MNAALHCGSTIARAAATAAGAACLALVPWNTPLCLGRVGCLVVGAHMWLVGVALLAVAISGSRMKADSESARGAGTD